MIKGETVFIKSIKIYFFASVLISGKIFAQLKPVEINYIKQINAIESQIMNLSTELKSEYGVDPRVGIMADDLNKNDRKMNSQNFQNYKVKRIFLKNLMHSQTEFRIQLRKSITKRITDFVGFNDFLATTKHIKPKITDIITYGIENDNIIVISGYYKGIAAKKFRCFDFRGPNPDNILTFYAKPEFSFSIDALNGEVIKDSHSLLFDTSCEGDRE